MSERDTPEYEDRVSPYLLRPARTYEEYLRDLESSERSGAPVSDTKPDRTDNLSD